MFAIALFSNGINNIAKIVSLKALSLVLQFLKEDVSYNLYNKKCAVDDFIGAH